MTSHIHDLITRRALLKRAALTLGAASLPLPVSLLSGCASSAASLGELRFASLPHSRSETLEMASGYRADILMRWGDPLFPGMDAFRPEALTAQEQTLRFGHNNDYLAYLPLDGSSEHGLLGVNHEYTTSHLMFPEGELTRARAEIEMAAHGHSVLEIRKEHGIWRVVSGSRYTRRFDGLATAFEITGPAAGHERLRTQADPSGRRAIGTYGNCAGGKTPWGTVLFAEENVNHYFSGETSGKERENHARFGIAAKGRYGWAAFDRRFDLAQEPREPNRFGWVVEYDPYDPGSAPRKRTALGRIKHESATAALCPDGRVAIYTGDDQANEYLYRFVSERPWNPEDRRANDGLLDRGVLSVARFEADGALQWLPLVFGHGPLTPENGFASQAEVLIETRRAADLLGATPMDRPEDIEVHPQSQGVFVALTQGDPKAPGNAANPRGGACHGHILELLPPNEDHAAERFAWEIFLLAGDPFDAESGARYASGITRRDYFSNPDNLAFDPEGRLWVATDGMEAMLGLNDGVYAMEISGPRKALPRHFLNVPRGAEATGPEFTPDGRTLFLSVQHPGDSRGSRYEAPSTRWPDFDPAMPPRPSVIAVTREDGGLIGS